MTRQAFTLAEMMIVLLVMTIILAAFAPLMT
ncbi:MAG: prepilin-type N-terminal cleavage/methylation domain-containing protein, partial [Heliobacteriaceae bacterium]|nr:prepilin-type N-terminal cleavage/methylation domain-containing protein [Heliobacteriaceae bacterium]